MSIIGDVFSSAADAAGSVFSTISDIVRPITNILGPVKLVADIAAGNIVGAVADIASVATNFADLSTDTALTAAADLADADFASAPDIGRAASDLAQQVSSGIISDDDSIIDSIRAGITDTDVFPARTVASTVADVIKPVQQAVASVSQVVKDVATPVTAVLDPITAVVKQINDGIIRPIIDPISTAINTFTRLADVIQRDLRDGIAGIVRIPGQLADALTSVDASFNRAIAQLGLVNAQIARMVLGPELMSASSSPLVAHAGIMATAFLTQSIGIGRVALTPMMSGKLPENVRKFLESLTDVVEGRAPAAQQEDRRKRIEAALDVMVASGGFPASLRDAVRPLFDELADRAPTIAQAASMLINIIQSAEFITTIIEDQAELFKQDAREKNPVMLLTSGDVVEATRRGIIDSAAALREFARQGINAERFAVLFDLTEQLLAVNDLIDARRRGIVVQEFFDAEMSRQGVSSDRSQIMLTLRDFVPGITDAIRMHARGIIDDNDMRVLLERNAVTPEIAQILIPSARAPASVAAVIEGAVFSDAVSLNFIAGSLGSAPPQSVLDAARMNQQSEDEARVAWQAHFVLPSAQIFIESFFRGLRTRSELTAALNLLNIPPETHDDVIETQRPLPRFTFITSFLEAGLINEQGARDLFAKFGYADDTIDLFIGLSRTRKKDSKAKTADETQQISISTANELFQQDSITLDQLIDVLVSHGFSPDTARLTAEVQAMRKQQRERSEFIRDVIDQINAGVIDTDTAQQIMFSAGFTQSEVSRAVRSAEKSRAKKSQSVTIDELFAMTKKNIIDETTLRGELLIRGFAPVWINRIIELKLGV